MQAVDEAGGRGTAGVPVEPTPDEVVDRIRRLVGHEALLAAELEVAADLDGDLTEHELLDDLAGVVERHLGGLLDPGQHHRLLARFDDVRDALVAAMEGSDAGLRVAVHAYPAAAGDEPGDDAVAEVMSVARWAHRGQVLATTATWRAAHDALPRQSVLVEAGHWVRDARQEPKRLFALQQPALMVDLPPALPEQLPPGELPGYTTEILGRDDELEQLPGRLRHGRILCLTGPPGTGKTRLAVELARRVDAASFPDGVRFCDASTAAGDADDLVARLAAVFERLAAPDEWTRPRPLGKAPRDLRSQLVATLKGRLLLVLDGCDGLRPDAWDLITEMLGDGEATVIATVRAPTDVPGQDIVRLGPLRVESGDPARELLAELTGGRAAGAAHSLTAPAVRDVIRRLGALPLALELTAPLLDDLGPAEVARRLQALLPDGDHQPQEALAAAVELAVEALSADQLRLCTALSALGGTWGPDAAESVAPAVGVHPTDATPILTTLARHALVRVEVASGGGTARYRMLDAVRDHVARRLARDGMESAARDAHAGHFLDLVRRSQAARRTPREPAWVRAVEVEFDNIRTAYRWLVDTGRVADALDLIWGLADDVVLRLRHEVGHWAEALGSDLATAGHPRQGAALAIASNTAFVEGRLDRAYELAGRALSVMGSEAEDVDGRWIALNIAALSAASREEERTATELFRQVVAPGGRRHPDPLAVVSGLYQGVLLYWLDGRPAKGAQLVGWLRDVEVASPSLRAMVTLAEGLACAGEDPQRARVHLERGMRLASAARSPLLYLHGWRGTLLLGLPSDDRRDLARRLLEVADEFRKRDNISEYVQTLVDVAWHAFRADDHALAATIGGYASQTQYRYSDRLRLLEQALRGQGRWQVSGPAWTEGAAMTLDDVDAHVHWAIGGWEEAR